MPQLNEQIKQHLSKLATDFQIEQNPFQKIVAIKNYIDYINGCERIKPLLVNIKDEKESIKKLLLKSMNDKLDFQMSVGEMLKEINFVQPELSIEDHPEQPLNKIEPYYSSLNMMVAIIELYKTVDEKRKKKMDDNFMQIAGNPQTIAVFTMMFTFLNANLFDYLNKSNFLNEDKQKLIDDKKKNQIAFNVSRSILSFRGDNIKISRKNDLPLDHYILEYIFEDELFGEEVYFKDIAEDKLFDKDYNSTTDWNKYYKACQRLQDKIRKSTRAKTDDFLLFNSGKTAHVKINPKYLKSCLKNKPQNID